MFPSSTFLAGLRGLAVGLTGSKAVIAGVAAIVAFGLVGAYGVTRLLDSTSAGGIGGSRSAPADMCAELFTYQCTTKAAQDFTSIEEAIAVASFEPALPAYIPEGYEPVIVRHTRPDFFAEFIKGDGFKEGCPGCDPRMSHNDQIGVYYRDAAGHQLAIIQGFPATLFLYDSKEESHRGKVAIGEYEAFWIRGLPSFAGPQPWDEGQFTLYWEIARVGDGWERHPDGTVLYGSPMSYSISSNSLPLEELIAIAESVRFD
jgi:hypothetical protein